MEDKPVLDMKYTIHWEGEAARLRLKVPTSIDSSGGIYEIPFGVVSRKPYMHGYNKKGEWPAQRFVAVEDGEYGVALVNTGVPGVEVDGGAIRSTLLRAPKTEYAGMIPDETSSQHGTHRFSFALCCYEGRWENAGILRFAHQYNSPVHVFKDMKLRGSEEISFFEAENDNLVVSAVKSPEDGAADEIILRLYESAGISCDARLYVRSAKEAWLSDLRETRGDTVKCEEGRMAFSVQPFEIKTLRVRRGKVI